MGYGLGSPTRSRNGDDGRHHRGRATPIAGDVDVGDQVNTPGGMHGTVKFIGVVKGKAGVFVGVELDHDMAGRGKNDGAVDGLVILFYVFYFGLQIVYYSIIAIYSLFTHLQQLWHQFRCEP